MCRTGMACLSKGFSSSGCGWPVANRIRFAGRGPVKIEEDVQALHPLGLRACQLAVRRDGGDYSRIHLPHSTRLVPRPAADSARRQHRAAVGKRRQCAVRGFRGACRGARAAASRTPAGFSQDAAQHGKNQHHARRADSGFGRGTAGLYGFRSALTPTLPMDSRKSVSPRHAALAVWMAALCVPALAAGADQLQATFDRMDRAAARFKGLSAEVTQVSHNALLNEDEAFTGTTAVRRGPKQRDLRAVVDILHPDPKKVLVTGHKVEMYYPKTNTVQIIDLDKKGSKMVDQFLLLGFGSASVEIRNAYTVEFGGPETVAGQKTVRLVLTPKAPEVVAKLPKVGLWDSRSLGIAIQREFWEPGGAYELATYTNVKLNPVPQELKWDVPKNAKQEKLNYLAKLLN